MERKTVVGLLTLVESERRGDSVDRPLLAQLLRCFSALGIYAGAFQAPFLTQTAEFYAAEGLQLMATTEVPGYLLHCEVGRACCAVLRAVASFWLVVSGQYGAVLWRHKHLLCSCLQECFVGVSCAMHAIPLN